jgi:hypothetical protein
MKFIDSDPSLLGHATADAEAPCLTQHFEAAKMAMAAAWHWVVGRKQGAK